MDSLFYIIIVLLALILFASYMVYRELGRLNYIILQESKSTKVLIEKQIFDSNNRISEELSTNFNSCINRIKTMNTENIRQLQNITLLNNQPITKIINPNHFTETDSDCRNESNIKYLS